MAQITTIIIFMLVICSIVIESTVVYTKYSNICGQNITLSETNIVLKIDFINHEKEPIILNKCTTFVEWIGSSDFRLIPKVVMINHHQSNHSNETIKNNENIVLDIIETPGKLFQLNIYGSKEFYLAMIPANVLNDISDTCPDNYLYCGAKYCIDRELVCDGTIHCYPANLICNDKSPSEQFIVLSFVGIVSSCLFVSLLLFLLILYKIRRINCKNNDNSLLIGDQTISKRKLYGTVNGDSFEYLHSSDHQPLSKALFYQNIKHYNQTIMNAEIK